MEVLSYTQARNKFSSLMDKVCDDHEPVTITRQKQRSVVLMSLGDFNSFEETCYLLKSAKNAERLRVAMSDLEKGRNFKSVVLG